MASSLKSMYADWSMQRSVSATTREEKKKTCVEIWPVGLAKSGNDFPVEAGFPVEEAEEEEEEEEEEQQQQQQQQ